MPLVCYVSEQNLNVPLDSDRLLRLLGVSVKLSGFYYAVYMLEQVQQNPDHVLLITKCLYKQTATRIPGTWSFFPTPTTVVMKPVFPNAASAL